MNKFPSQFLLNIKYILKIIYFILFTIILIKAALINANILACKKKFNFRKQL